MPESRRSNVARGVGGLHARFAGRIGGMRDWLEQVWYRAEPPPLALRPLSLLYAVVSRPLAQRRQHRAQRLPVPVIVVGNIAVGGTGKTPCVLWLVEALQSLGRRPGILSRGYGGAGPFPRLVRAGDDPRLCGDEPALLAERAQVPLAVAPDRAMAGQLLLAAHPDLDVLICDDGLQHYQLARDLEFCVIDGQRGYGNGWLLPAGPLREPPARALQAAAILVNGGPADRYGDQALRFDLQTDMAVNLLTGERRSLREFGGGTVHAVAGIGNPGRFFDGLRGHALTLREHPFADHHRYAASDLDFGDASPMLMTEKDAVKCRGFAQSHWWSVPAELRFAEQGAGRLRKILQNALHAPATKA